MAESTSPNPAVFISWAHRDPEWDHADEAAWAREVYGFGLVLRSYGVDVDIDLFHQAEPGVDWTRFGPRAIDDVEWVIVALSRGWRERWEGRNLPTEGAGAVAEADALKSLFARDQDAFRRKVVLVTLPSRQREDVVPTGLDGVQRRSVSDYSLEEVTPLIRLLTNQPEFPVAPLGGIPELPPVEPPPIDSAREQATGTDAAGRLESPSERLSEIDEQIGAIEEALARTPEPEAADGPDLLSSRAWRNLNDRLAGLAEARAQVNPRDATDDPTVHRSDLTGGQRERPPGPDDSGLRAAAQRLRYDLEAQRRKIARSLDLARYWVEPRQLDAFERYGPVLMEQRPLVWDPVSFAYMWFNELNESVELGAAIPVGQSEQLQQGVDQLAHASATLLELIVEMSQPPAVPSSTPASGESAGRARVVPSLTPEVLRARVYPYQYLSVMDTTEKALCVRTVAAVSVPKGSQPTIGSPERESFEELMQNSAFEKWIKNVTAPHGHPSGQHISWRPSRPTRSTILTLARARSLTYTRDWLIDARAVINLTPNVSIQPSGAAWANLDLIVRPNQSDESRWLPLSLDDLFGLLCVQLTTLLDETLPSLMPRLTERDDYALHAVDSILAATGASLGDFVLLMRSGWHRIEDAYDLPGAELGFEDYRDTESPERRAAVVRNWLKTLLLDAGISGHEPSIDSLVAPT